MHRHAEKSAAGHIKQVDMAEREGFERLLPLEAKSLN
jgi:hypothetical protein